MVVANRYAKALFEQAVSLNKVQEVYENLNKMNQTIQEVEEFKHMVASPIVTASDKKQVCAKVFGSFAELTTNFINLVIDNGREMLMSDMLRAFEVLYFKSQKIDQVKVTTAKVMSDKQSQLVKDKLTKEFGLNDVSLDAHVDASIIGGVIIQLGDKEYDGSVLNKLKRIKQQAISQ